jgi:hypothetical protein
MNEPNVSLSERQALVAFYEATGGENWKQKDGWLGPNGTECNWFGIKCRPDYSGDVSYVQAIDLTANNLVGSVPSQLAELKHLSLLLLHDNHVTLAEEILKKWDAGELDLRFGTHYSSISKITLTQYAQVLCAWEKYILDPDGSVIWFHERCKPSKNGSSPETFCEIKEGRTYDFDRLARFLEVNGFFSDRTVDPDRGVWIDVGNIEIKVERNQQSKIIEIGSNGDGSLAEWSFDKAIRGVASEIEWEKTRRSKKCPMN